MSVVNNASIIGRLTKDIELRTVGDEGRPVANFIVAVNKYTGGDRSKADFIDCVAWNKTAEFISKYFNKGMKIGVQGELSTNMYTDSEGKTRKSTVILVDNVSFIDSKAATDSDVEVETPDAGMEEEEQDLPF